MSFISWEKKVKELSIIIPDEHPGEGRRQCDISYFKPLEGHANLIGVKLKGVSEEETIWRDMEIDKGIRRILLVGRESMG